LCGHNGNIDSDLCENWIKASSMSPLMKMTVDSGEPDDVSLKILFTINLINIWLYIKQNKFYKGTV
jgi:hypothetical protein